MSIKVDDFKRTHRPSEGVGEECADLGKIKEQRTDKKYI
jgi:hypothetical protein